jgi:hypothetical protein
VARFAAPWDRTLRVTTTLVVLFLAGAAATFAVVALRASVPLEFVAGIAALVAVILGATWALAPRGFSLEAGQVRIERPLRSVAVPFRAVTSASLLPPGALRGAVRLGGSGGLFGYYGRYWSKTLGAFRLYATRREGLVRIDTADERFVLSPEPAERFLEEILARAPEARSGADAPLARRPVGRRAKLAIGAALLLVPLVVLGVLGASWAWKPVGALVGERAVVIERQWAGPVEIPFAEIREVEILPPEALRGARRVAGYSGGGVHYGRFQSQALGGFQLYAWRFGPAVLLETSEGRVVLTPEDPVRFAEDVQAAVVARPGSGPRDDPGTVR